MPTGQTLHPAHTAARRSAGTRLAHRPVAVVAAARARGLTAIDGWDVLLADAGQQFRLMTGHDMPADPTRTLLRAARVARRDPQPTNSDRQVTT